MNERIILVTKESGIDPVNVERQNWMQRVASNEQCDEEIKGQIKKEWDFFINNHVSFEPDTIPLVKRALFKTIVDSDNHSEKK